MQFHGEEYYRTLELKTLQQIINLPPCIIALGGGAVLSEINQDIIQPHIILHLTAPLNLVLQRIMANGIPAFFPQNKPIEESFEEIWNTRMKIYEKLTTKIVHNDDTLEKSVANAIKCLKLCQ